MNGRLSDRDERHREREFYKYYEPIRALQKVKSVNLFDAQEAAEHVPISSPDTALTAFCQLGALRCHTRRCLLFFFDHQYAYILAEATKTLSLTCDDIHEEDDALWLGNAIIPRGLSVCEHTVNIPDENFGSNKDEPNAGAVHIIDDLKDDTRFCDRPFVTDGPKARFYAGVPITTPSGIRIGAYCVLDDKPRATFEQKHVDFLIQMSSTVMDHLENIRLRSEYAKGANMLTSMGSFLNAVPTRQVDRASITRSASPASTTSISAPISPKHEDKDYFTVPLVAENGTNNEPSIASFQTLATPIPAATTGVQDHAYGGSPKPFPEQKTVEQPQDPVATAATTSPGGHLTKRNVQLEDDMDETLETSIRGTFQLAAELIRKAADVSGIQFIDVSSNAGRANMVRRKTRPSTNSRTRSGSLESITDTTGTDGTDGTAGSESEDGQPRTIKTGASTILGRSEEKPSTLHQASVSRVPNSLLRRILRRAPVGRVFNFSAEGEASATESVTEQEDQDKTEAEKSIRTKTKKSSDSEELLHYFPGARAICVLGLWDAPQSRLYAGAVMWTCSSLRIFTNAGDLNYLRAFCDVIMANVSRIEARFDLQSKSQFISSISHELRSPLHGILGSIDFLHEQDQIDWTMISQIERSSITLMDIIENLLVFAKVNYSGDRNRKLRKRKGLRRKASTDEGSAAESIPGKEKAQSLVKLTEDVIDAIYHSHCCVYDEAQLSKVDLILDTNMDERYTCNIPVGAWKRICMNITNNALKYTREGYVRISLKTLIRPRKVPAAVFEVTDTGCGMSKHFLQNQLFRAFSQENSLSTGTGLGMSLVAKLVRSVAGQIDVTSVKNVGTTVQITIPLQQQEVPESSRALPYQGVRLTLLEFDPASTESTKSAAYGLRHTALKHACAQIGASLVFDNAAIDLIFESDLLHLLTEDKGTSARKKKPLIVLCNTLTSASTLRQSVLAQSLGRHLAFIAQPFGPDRLAQAVKDCNLHDAPRSIDHSDAGVPAQADLRYMRKAFSTQRRESSWMKTIALDRNDDGAAEADRKARNAELLAILEKKQPTTQNETIEPDPGLEPSEAAKPGHNRESLSRYQSATENIAPSNTNATNTALSQKLCLLLVDDNPVNLRILKTYAQRNHHEHQTATNGEEAVETYRKSIQETNDANQIIDVIFMDLNMPVLDGFEATRAIRSLEKSHGCRPATVIALTGLGSAEAQQTARACGIDIFLTKPIRPRSLDPLLRSIEESRKRDEDHVPIRSGSGKTEPSKELTLTRSTSDEK